MTQVTNYAVPNGPRADVRQAFNAILAAVRDFNSGPTAPANPVPGMPWLDTSTTPSTLRVRNDANSAWVTAFTAWFSGDAASARTALGLGAAALLAAGGNGGAGVIGVGSGTVPALGAGGLLDAARIPLSVGARLIRTVAIPSAVAAVDFTSADMDLTKYSNFEFVLQNVRPVTAAGLRLRTSSDGGATFSAGSSDYAYALSTATSASTAAADGSLTVSSIPLNFSITHATVGGGMSGNISIYGADRAQRQKISFNTSHWRADGNFERIAGAGMRLADTQINGARFLFSAGNIQGDANSFISIYGVAK